MKEPVADVKLHEEDCGVKKYDTPVGLTVCNLLKSFLMTCPKSYLLSLLFNLTFHVCSLACYSKWGKLR